MNDKISTPKGSPNIDIYPDENISSFNKNILGANKIFGSVNKFYVITESLKAISTICNSIEEIKSNPEHLKIFCSACFFLLSAVNDDLFALVVKANISKEQRNQFNIEKTMFNLIISCIHWACKIVTMKDTVKSRKLIETAFLCILLMKVVIATKSTPNFSKSTVVEISRQKTSMFRKGFIYKMKDVQDIVDNITKGTFMPQFFIDMLISKTLPDPLYILNKTHLKVLLLTKDNVEIEKFKDVFEKNIVEIYKNPKFWFFTTEELVSIVFYHITSGKYTVEDSEKLLDIKYRKLFDTHQFF